MGGELSRGKLEKLILHHAHLPEVAEVFPRFRRVVALVLLAFVVTENHLVFPVVNIGTFVPFHSIFFIHACIIPYSEGFVKRFLRFFLDPAKAEFLEEDTKNAKGADGHEANQNKDGKR